MNPDQDGPAVVVDISCVISSKSFQETSYLWVTPSREYNIGHSDIKRLINFETEIKNFYKSNHQSSNDCVRKQGSVACLFYQKKWRRVEVATVKDTGLVSVFLLDFGGFATCHLDELMEIPDSIEVPKVILIFDVSR